MLSFVGGLELDEEHFTGETWSVLSLALSNAQVVFDDPVSSQDDVDEAVIGLSQAEVGLENPIEWFEVRINDYTELLTLYGLSPEWETTGVMEVRLPKHNTDGELVTKINRDAFRGKNLIGVRIPEGYNIDRFSYAEFRYNLITSISIPNSFTGISTSMFFSNQLSSITIPDSVELIEGDAFTGNPGGVVYANLLPQYGDKIEDDGTLTLRGYNFGTGYSIHDDGEDEEAIIGEFNYGAVTLPVGTAEQVEWVLKPLSLSTKVDK